MPFTQFCDLRDYLLQTAGHAQNPAAPLRMCGLCGTWNSKPCGEQCGFQITDPTFEQIAFANAAEAAALSDTSTDCVAQMDRAPEPDEGRKDAGSNPVAVATSVTSPVGWGGHLPGGRRIEP
jgi:hypothetical protein